MKRPLFSLLLMFEIITLSSCDYDDSNDIDILTPIDSSATRTENPSPS